MLNIQEILSVMLFGCLLLDATIQTKFEVKKVVVVNSYHYKYHVNPFLFNRGLKKGLFKMKFLEGRNFKLTNLYMATKKINTSPEKKNRIANEFIKLIKKKQPDVVLTFDDDAFELVGLPLYREFPVIFAGLNSRPIDYNNTKYPFMKKGNQTTGTNITGIFEPNFVGSTIQFFHLFFPSIVTKNSTIVFLYDQTNTMKFILKETKRELREKNTLREINAIHIRIGTFDEFKENIAKFNADPSIKMIFPFTTSLRDGDRNVVGKEIHRYLIENSKKIDVATNSEVCKNDKLLGGVGTDIEKMGEMTGDICAKFLLNQIKLGDYPIAYSQDVPFNVFLNKNRADSLGLSIDQKMVDGLDYFFFDDNRYLIIFLITCVSFVIFAVVSVLLIILLVTVMCCIQKIQKRREKNINSIVKAIIHMDIEDNPRILKLREKKRKTKTEKLLERIIFILHQLAPYYPKYLKLSEETQFEDSQDDSLEKQSNSGMRISYLPSSFDEKSEDSSTSTESGNKERIYIGNYLKKKDKIHSVQLTHGLIKFVGISNLIKKSKQKKHYLVLFNNFVKICSSIIKESNGIIHFISGTSIFCSWGGAKRVIQHFKKACYAGTKISGSFKRKIAKEEKYFRKTHHFNEDSKMDIQISFLKTDSFVGNVGDKEKFFTSISSAFEILSEMLQVIKEEKTNVVVRLEDIDSLKFDFYHQLIDLKRKYHKKLCTLIPIEQSTNKDWKYMFDEINKNNHYKIYNKAVEQYWKGDLKTSHDSIIHFLKLRRNNSLGIKFERKIQQKLTTDETRL